MSYRVLQNEFNRKGETQFNQTFDTLDEAVACVQHQRMVDATNDDDIVIRYVPVDEDQREATIVYGPLHHMHPYFVNGVQIGPQDEEVFDDDGAAFGPHEYRIHIISLFEEEGTINSKDWYGVYDVDSQGKRMSFETQCERALNELLAEGHATQFPAILVFVNSEGWYVHTAKRLYDLLPILNQNRPIELSQHAFTLKGAGMKGEYTKPIADIIRSLSHEVGTRRDAECVLVDETTGTELMRASVWNTMRAVCRWAPHGSTKSSSFKIEYRNIFARSDEPMKSVVFNNAADAEKWFYDNVPTSNNYRVDLYVGTERACFDVSVREALILFFHASA